jgi:hypothetical protein
MKQFDDELIWNWILCQLILGCDQIHYPLTIYHYPLSLVLLKETFLLLMSKFTIEETPKMHINR